MDLLAEVRFSIPYWFIGVAAIAVVVVLAGVAVAVGGIKRRR